MMIDDGKHDPPEVKIEDHPQALAAFARWERELQPAKRRKSRLWALLETIGRTYGGY
jgi:hypothetical protein